MRTVEKNCANCLYGADAPLSMKPIYGWGGIMLACTKPTTRKGIEMVAPKNKCRSWLSGKKHNEQCEAAEAAQKGETHERD